MSISISCLSLCLPPSLQLYFSIFLSLSTKNTHTRKISSLSLKVAGTRYVCLNDHPLRLNNMNKNLNYLFILYDKKQNKTKHTPLYWYSIFFIRISKNFFFAVISIFECPKYSYLIGCYEQISALQYRLQIFKLVFKLFMIT